MKKIVLSVGGSILVPSLESNNISKFSGILKELSKKYAVYVVVGGGGEARRYIDQARKLGIDEATSDELGILVTRINASMLVWALGDAAYRSVPEDYTEALIAGDSGKIVVMGGVTPAQTTDAVSAVLAERAGADFFVNVTSVDGIYSEDPKKNPGAVKYENITPDELLEIVSGAGMEAGSNTVIDLVAAKVLKRSGIPLVVIDGRRPENLRDALIDGKFSGSIVSPGGVNPLDGI
ncbi:UMP kinase [Methanolacinia paynteri]|uniref:UMP kinase n=1 Tax=Methanolacinia paynteri TaxID=230356 RepID=UPI00064ED3D4|nr:UMP kinase [Methanolacinia paynteri]